MGTFSESCITIFINNDMIRELLQENFTIALNPLDSFLSSQFLNVTVDETPSYIVILDDDSMCSVYLFECSALLPFFIYTALGAKVYFEQTFVSFSEADGDQSIYLLMTGGHLQSDTIVVVYNIDNGKIVLLDFCVLTIAYCLIFIGMDVGNVTLTANSGNQRVSFSLSITDNNVALEPNKTLRLGIRKSSSVDTGTPSEITIVIVDDDGECLQVLLHGILMFC